MPTCPGCKSRVPHSRLDQHELHCDQLGTEQVPQDVIRRLEARINTLESRLEAVEQRQSDTESDTRVGPAKFRSRESQ